MAQTIEGFVGTSLDDARMSPIHWRVFALIAAGYFFDVADYVILGALIPDMVSSGFATPAQIATVASATLFGLFVGTLAQGEFTDRFGRKTVYQFNLLAVRARRPSSRRCRRSSIWFDPASPGCCFLAGIGLGAEQPLCFSYTAEYAPKNIRGRFIAGVQLIGGAWSWPVGTLFDTRLPRHDRLARHLDHHRHRARWSCSCCASRCRNRRAGWRRTARATARSTCCSAWACAGPREPLHHRRGERHPQRSDRRRVPPVPRPRHRRDDLLRRVLRQSRSGSVPGCRT